MHTQLANPGSRAVVPPPSQGSRLLGVHRTSLGQCPCKGSKYGPIFPDLDGECRLLPLPQSQFSKDSVLGHMAERRVGLTH